MRWVSTNVTASIFKDEHLFSTNNVMDTMLVMGFNMTTNNGDPVDVNRPTWKSVLEYNYFDGTHTYEEYNLDHYGAASTNNVGRRVVGVQVREDNYVNYYINADLFSVNNGANTTPFVSLGSQAASIYTPAYGLTLDIGRAAQSGLTTLGTLITTHPVGLRLNNDYASTGAGNEAFAIRVNGNNFGKGTNAWSSIYGITAEGASWVNTNGLTIDRAFAAYFTTPTIGAVNYGVVADDFESKGAISANGTFWTTNGTLRSGSTILTLTNGVVASSGTMFAPSVTASGNIIQTNGDQSFRASSTNVTFVTTNGVGFRLVGKGLAGGTDYANGAEFALYYNADGNEQIGIRNTKTGNIWRWAGDVYDFIAGNGTELPFTIGNGGVTLTLEVTNVYVRSNLLVRGNITGTNTSLSVSGTVTATNGITGLGTTNHFTGDLGVAGTMGIGTATVTTMTAGSVTGNGVGLTNLTWVETNSHTFTSPVYSSSTSTSTPAGTEFVTGEWVRGLFSGGNLLYNCTNSQPYFTNYDVWYSALATTNAVAQVRTYNGVTNGQYLGTGIATTNRFTQVNSPMTVNAYLSFNTGGGRAVTVHPEFYYCYAEPKTNAVGVFTNILGDFSAGGQVLIAGTNLYTWVVPFSTVTATNTDGFWVLRRFKVDSQNANPNVTIHGSGNFPSTIGFENPSMSAMNIDGSNVVSGTLAAARLAPPTNGYFLTYDGTGGTNKYAAIPGGGDMLAATYNPNSYPAGVESAKYATNLVGTVAASALSVITNVAAGWSVDGGGTTISTGRLGAPIYIPMNSTIVGFALSTKNSGTVVVDIWKTNTCDYPALVAGSICANLKPSLNSAIKTNSYTLTGWSNTLAQGDWLSFNVDSQTTISNLTFQLLVTPR